MIELVCPAGNLEKLHYAYAYGADSAYIGLKKFSLRVKADNFYDDEYTAIRALKERYPNKRLFCAMNISFHNRNIDNFLSEIDYFKLYPFDAFIVQDIGMVNIVQKHFPNAALHLSTQANCINREAAKMYYRMGFKRIVMGREVSLAEIREIKDAVPELEIEAFVHGAMCIAYSGRCLMSAYLNGRSANGGACSHSCRWEYTIKQDMRALAESGTLVLEEKERPGQYFPIFEGENFTAMLSSKDLCMIDYLDELLAAGIDSLKIEGRMKSLYYVALITRAYRKAIDAKTGIISTQDAKPFIAELYNSQHREFGTGFYFGANDANETTSGESSGEYEMAGTIGSRLDNDSSLEITNKGQKTLTNFQADFNALHPDAQVAKKQDLKNNPEKVPQCPLQKEGWKYYPFKAMNKIGVNIPLECIDPNAVSIPLSIADYQFINPEDGTRMNWVSHGHDCLLYTSVELGADSIVRIKSS